jgi:hypothetical protein
MPRRLTALAVPLALVAFGFGLRGSFSAPLIQSVRGESAASLQRVELRKTHDPLKHCFKRKGVQSCRGVGAAPDGASVGTTGSSGTLPLPNNLPPGASFGHNRRTEPKPVESQAGHDGPSSGVKFTGGVGVPTNRATLEGALSPYQQPNGNTSAATSGKLSNGIEAQGMHFGLEWHY